MIHVENKLDKESILNLYTNGTKKISDFTIGIEYERIPIRRSALTTVGYWDEYGIKNLLELFSKENSWDYIKEKHNIIGLKSNHDTITLEPGSQVEISTRPEKNIFELKNKIDKINNQLKILTNKMGISLLSYGVSPYTTYKGIQLIPKNRYKIMARYLWGILSDVMMRETAGIQCCLDFESEEDAIRKFKLANKLTPFVTAMFANSPIRGGVDTGYKSFRALSWLNTDNDRCGFAGKISEEFSFEDYIDCVLKTPMIYIDRNNEQIQILGDITFEEFLSSNYKQFSPNISDYELQANLYFPEVRLRNFIEIRNQDCVGGDLKYAILAIYKGIMYNLDALKECEELLKPLQYKDYSELRYNVPKNTLQTKIKKATVYDFAKEIITIAEKGLRNQNSGEEIFLDKIKEYTFNNITPADIILRNWYGLWDRDLRKLIRYLEKEDE